MLSIFQRLPKIKNIRPAEQTEKYGPLLESIGGQWRMEKGALRKPYTVTSVYLEKTGLTFDQVLLAYGIGPYKLGGFDATFGDPHIIALDEEFIYVDWRGPTVWKIYHMEDGRFRLLDELAVGIDEKTALIVMQRHMKRSN